MHRSGKDTVKNILLFNILIYLFSSHFRITFYYTCGWLTESSVNFNQGLRAMTRRFCAHWAKSYSAVLQASTTSKLYQISMVCIVKCYQVRSQSLKTATGGPMPEKKRSRDGIKLRPCIKMVSMTFYLFYISYLHPGHNSCNLVLCWKVSQRPSPHQDIFKIHIGTRPT